MTRGARRAPWPLVAAAAVAGLGELVRRRRSSAGAPPTPETAPLPPLTTQSSPGQIADLQQAYGADMAPRPGADGSPG